VIRRWRGGDQVLVRMGGDALIERTTWVRGRVLRAPCEAREGRAVTVDCDDGWRRNVDPSRLRPALRLVPESER
jgi:hypothetical protein